MSQFEVTITTDSRSVTRRVSAPTEDEAALTAAKKVFRPGSKIESREGAFEVSWVNTEGADMNYPFSAKVREK